jgi:hypothetical protein
MRHVLAVATPYYLDAGTGSMLVQMAVAGLAGAAVFLKVGWAKITGPFRHKSSGDEVRAEGDPTQPHQPADD